MLKKLIFTTIMAISLCSCETTHYDDDYDHFVLDEENWVEDIEHVVNNILRRLAILEDNSRVQDDHIDKLAYEIEDLYACVEDLQLQLDEKDTQLEKIEKTIDDKSKSISDLKTEIGEIKKLAESLSTQIEEIKKEMISAQEE